MSEHKKQICAVCDHFADGIGENGYCKLYHNNIVEPERICSRFEATQSKVTQLRFKKDKKDAAIKSESDYKFNKHLFYIFGIIETIVLGTISVFVALILARTIWAQDVSAILRGITAVADIAFFTLFVKHLVMVLRKHRTNACIIYTLFLVAILIVLILNYNNIWLTVNDVADKVVKFFFFDILNL